MQNKLEMALAAYADFLKADYNKWSNKSTLRTLNRQLVVEFDIGNKFIKVIVGHSNDGMPDNNRSSHSFIVLNGYQGKKNLFKHGDILKSASWRAPAKNFSRGNILDKEYGTIAWCGA